MNGRFLVTNCLKKARKLIKKKVGRNPKSCSKSEKLRKSCRASNSWAALAWGKQNIEQNWGKGKREGGGKGWGEKKSPAVNPKHCTELCSPTNGKQQCNLRATCCKDHLYLCKIEKIDFLKICQEEGFYELVSKL